MLLFFCVGFSLREEKTGLCFPFLFHKSLCVYIHKTAKRQTFVGVVVLLVKIGGGIRRRMMMVKVLTGVFLSDFLFLATPN